MKNEFSFAEPLKNKQEENYTVLPADDKQRKYYMVVFYYKEGDTKVQIVRGQYNTRMTIINNLDFIDIDESFVLVEDVGFVSKPQAVRSPTQERALWAYADRCYSNHFWKMIQKSFQSPQSRKKLNQKTFINALELRITHTLLSFGKCFGKNKV